VLTTVVPILRQTKYRVVGAAKRYRYSGIKAFWALGDQGIVSLGNFITNLILAQRLPLAELGLYGIVYELSLFLNSMQAAMILFPLNVKGAVAEEDFFTRLAGRSIICTLLLAPLLGLGLLATGVAVRQPMVGIWAMVALVVFQIQETLRRSLIIQMRFRGAMWGDAISYLGQGVALFTLAHLNMLTLTSAFQSFALTSALAAIVQWIQVRPHRATVAEAMMFARRSWGLSRWVLFSNITGLFTGTLFYWNLAWWAGREMLGVAMALMNVVRIANPFMLAFGSMIAPAVARADGRVGMSGARRMFMTYGGIGLAGLILLFALPIAFPDPVLRVFYPRSAENYLPYTAALRLMIITTLCIFVKDMVGVFFNAVQLPRFNFIGQATFTGVMVLVAMPLTARYHLMGLAVGGLIGCAVHASFNTIIMCCLRRGSDKTAERAPRAAAHDTDGDGNGKRNGDGMDDMDLEAAVGIPQ
jgi:O-antigen/teichoic acid export membrane protein